MTGSSESDKAKENLAAINNSPMLARRDAAYARMMELLRQNIFSLSEKDRYTVYDACIKLVDEVFDITSYTIKYPVGVSPRKARQAVQQTVSDPFLNYLDLLRDMLKTILDIVNVSGRLGGDEKKLLPFLGKPLPTFLRTTEEILGENEINFYHCITEFIDFSETSVHRYLDHRRRALQKEELERYNRAMFEFKNYFAKFGATSKNDTPLEIQDKKNS